VSLSVESNVDERESEFARFAHDLPARTVAALEFLDNVRHANDAESAAALRQLLHHEDDIVRAAAIDVLSYRRQLEGRELLPLLDDEPRVIRDAAFAALVRVGDASVRNALEDVVCAAPSDATDVQLLGLMRLGSSYALDLCRASALVGAARRGHLLGLALGGGAGDWHLLAQQLSRPALRGAAADAIGVHGEPAAVPVLIDLLEQGDSLGEVVEALQTITGIRQGPEASPWRAWWISNEGTFAPGLRYRQGRPFSLLQCIGELSRGRGASSGRHRALAELEIRSGQRYPFELDGPWDHQRAALAQWQSWWRTSEQQFRPGSWTFHGGTTAPCH
jgi:hypothetical protein